jgi:signal transduction histidine kinase
MPNARIDKALGTPTSLPQEARSREALVSSVEMIDCLEKQLRLTAYALHDGPVQTLACAGAMLERAQRSSDLESVRAEAAAAGGLIDRAILEIRDMMSELRPVAMDACGLVQKIRTHAAEFEAAWGIPVGVTVVGEKSDLSGRCQCSVLRIVQESLTNVRRHADAHRADVRLAFGEDDVTVTVADDGVGFNPHVGGFRSSFGRWGLSGMRERVALLGGELQIMSTPDRGTRVRARIPKDTSWL